MEQPHAVYSKHAAVHLAGGATKEEAFDEAIRVSRFIEHVEKAIVASGKKADSFAVAIKPNIMTASQFQQEPATYTDPALVERLIARLREVGLRRITVVEAQNVYNYSYQGRTVQAVAAMCGYSGQGYDIEDQTQTAVPFDYGSVLGRHLVGRAWKDADYRISFAKNKTHWQSFHTGCIKNVYGCLPAWDKMKVYHGKNIEFFEAAVLMADRFPVHFGFLDAWMSSDGFSGHVRDAHPNPTRTIFASDNIYALDWVATEKTGIDPAFSLVLQEALHRWGTIAIERRGDLAPWQDWNNVRPFVVVFMNWIEELYGLSRFFSRAFAAYQDERFPPTSRMQWLYAVLHWMTRRIEGLLTRKAPAEAEAQMEIS